MSTTEEVDQGRVSKREFTARFARRAGVPVRVASAVYEAMIEELLDIVASGDKVTLTGFGKFYPQMHKGHSVQKFPGAASEHEEQVDDYAVLKFSATREVNKRVTPSREKTIKRTH
jgi:DNA-binding protein HU-beta